ncbi:hypothetical protein GCM10009836_14880 [Pseudonocardia ailaonensis]|uniref:Uncharacterized protein n=1 Tax=Pseudonocardia ailaonensis TaxID=367279 RepID=A0ABN2MSL5_9PSEU
MRGIERISATSVVGRRVTASGRTGVSATDGVVDGSLTADTMPQPGPGREPPPGRCAVSPTPDHAAGGTRQDGTVGG